MLVQSAILDFLSARRADGRSARTVLWYEQRLDAVGRTYFDRDVESITTNDLRSVINALRTQKRQLAESTIAGYIRAFKALFSFAEREYSLTKNPMIGIARARPSKRTPKAISIDAVKALFRYLESDDSAYGARDRAIVAFLMDTGCRAGGLVSLADDRLELDRGRALLTEKGDRDRYVPFSPFTGALIRTWIDVRPPGATTTFCALHPSHLGAALTVSGLNQVTKRRAHEAGVSGRVNPHSFRHGFAREFLKNGGNLSVLSDLLGHSSTTVTTQFYAVFAADELQKMHAQFSPIRALESKE